MYWIRTFRNEDDFIGDIEHFKTLEELHGKIDKANVDLEKGIIVDFEVSNY